ncbi:MAG: hypothetical protein HXY46_14190 [Syntrophaceae bacterium]|nr:hypothetical protein [Syntrophaceae bacterium]
MEKDHLPLREFSRGEMRGCLRDEILNSLASRFFEDPVSFVEEMGGEVLKSTRLRWAAIFTLPTGQRIFLKRDKTKGWTESLRYLVVPSKARKEWSIAHRLHDKALNIPEPLGWMERRHRGLVKESYYLSEAVGSGTSLIESIKLGGGIPVDQLARTVREVHEAGLFHKDFHAGNFLWDRDSFYLSDLHRAKIVPSLSLNQKLFNLSQLFQSLRLVWKAEDRQRFIETYFEADSDHLRRKEELLQRIHFTMDRLQTRHWQSRTKRCLKETTEFTVKREGMIRYYHRRDFPLDCLKKAIGEHLSLIGKGPSFLVKDSSEVRVSILTDGNKRVCVKQFCYPTLWKMFKENFRRSRGLRAWVAGNGLRARGIPCLKPLALMERRNWMGLKESFFLMEASEGDHELDRYLSKGFIDFKEKRSFINTFAQWLSKLHKMNLYHEDMKTCNIVVSKHGEIWNFYLLDLEDVRLGKKVVGRKLFRSLLQLNTSTPKVISTADRIRFLKAYLNHNPMVEDRKNFLKELVVESKRRDLVYISPGGTVIEKL